MGLENFKKRLVIDKIPIISKGEVDFTFSYKMLKETSESASLSLKKNKRYKPQSKDRLYFYQDCNVPRYKVRDWGAKNNVSITIKIDNATASFCTDDILLKYRESVTYVTYNKNAFINWVKDNYDESQDNIKEFLTVLESYTDNENILIERYINSEIVHCLTYNYYNKNLSYYGFKSDFAQHDINDSLYSYTYFHMLDEQDYEDLKKLENDPNLYHQDDIFALITDGSTVIDTEMFENLRTMFNSVNINDKVLALEIVANCNIVESLHYVMLLLKEFNSVICNLKESNHINFKSLLEYIGFDKRNLYQINEDIIIQCLMDKNLLTMPILKECATAVKNEWIAQGRSKYFVVDTITVSDEIKEYFSNLAEN